MIMPAMVPLYSLMEIPPYILTKDEILILEAELFVCICEELRNYFKNQLSNYFCLMKFTTEKENTMLEINFINLIIKDILSSEEYTLEGIARYTDTHQDIVQDVITEINTSPSAKLLRRIIELHRSIRRDLYNEIMKKIVMKHIAVT